MYLCEICNQLTLHDLEDGYMLYSDVELLIQETERENPCSLCSLVWRSLGFTKFFRPVVGAVHLFLNPPPSHTLDRLQYVDIIVTTRNVSEFSWGLYVPGEPSHLGPPDYKDGTVGQTRFKYRVPFWNSEEDDCFLLAKEWLNDCLRLHGSSCQGEVVELPDRLVDVGPTDGSGTLRLIATKETNLANAQSLRYAALSYCWGKDTFLTTQSSTLPRFMASIVWDALPKTVRDAIIVTRRLGVRYLWVDALCIIQGNDYVARSDWKRESANMHNIYGGAFVTLSAAHAAHANEGLFHRRNVEPRSFCALKSTSKYPGTVFLGPEPPPLLSYMEALNTRAWTLQERILSNRVLTYGTNGIRWMCHGSLHHETAPHLGHQGFRVVETEERTNSINQSHQKPQWMLTEWKGIIEQFSQRDLTDITDKLPAISGLAQVINKSCGDKYLAGLWHSDVLQQLMWPHTEDAKYSM
ncbi:hypothetical protein N0V90_010225 [Kalmusia sp. IMI 367209]|nr:hypothetical protein N0V90_010225 [Kalmusia sp. IMI 367209]